MKWKQLLQLRLSSLLWIVLLASVLFGWWHDHRRLTAGLREVVATKSGFVLTRQDLADACLDRYGDEMLERVINRRLVMDASSRSKIFVTDRDVDYEVDRVTKKYGISEEVWYRMLEEERGLDRSRYCEDVVLPSLLISELARRNPKEHASLLAALRTTMHTR